MSGLLPQYSYKGREYVILDCPVEILEETKCAVCHELINQPVHTSCEHLFCRNCIKRQLNCPICRKYISSRTQDVGTNKVLKVCKVKCPNSSEGCDWKGALGDAEEHLKDCQCEEVECLRKCEEKMKRKLLQNHTKHDCPNRRYTCPHCDHVGVYKDVTTVHITNCRDFPLPCPAGCGKEITRKNMKSHLSTECPEEYICCKFTTFGCDTAVRRREKESHFSDDTLHLQRLMEFQMPLMQSLRTLFWSSAHITPNVASLPLFFRPWLQNTPTCYPRPPWVVKLEGFEEKKRNNEDWYSNPVYSHFGGYKMCLRVCPNGHKSGKDTRVSVYIYLMKGDNNDNLKFPFKGRVVVSLLNQLAYQNHLTKKLWSPESNVPEDVSGRVTTEERTGNGWGYDSFILHENLNYNSDKNCQYLKNDCLFFRVDKFECVF